MKVFASWNPNKSGGKKASKAKGKKRETVQASRAYTSKPKGTFQLIREGARRVVSAAGNAIRRRVH